MLVMISLGVGEVLGGLAMGGVVDRIGTKRSCVINSVNIAIASLFVIYYIANDQYNWKAYAMTFLWGWQDSCISIHLDAILGFEFETNKEPFSIEALTVSLTTFIFLMIESQLTQGSEFVIYICFVGILGVLMSLITLKFDYRARRVMPENFIEEFIK